MRVLQQPRTPWTAAALAVLMGLSAPAGAHAQRAFSLTLYDQPDYRGGSVTIYGDNANLGSTGFSARARSAQVRGSWRLCEGGGYRNRCAVFAANVRDLAEVGFAGRVGSAQFLGPAAAAAPRPTPRPQPLAARAADQEPDYTPPAVDAPLAAPSRLGRRAAIQPPEQAAPAPASPPPVAAAPARSPRRTTAAAPAPIARQPARPRVAPMTIAPNAYGEDPAPGISSVFYPAPTIRGADVAAWTPRGAADAFCVAQGFNGAIYADQTQRSSHAVDVDGRAVGEGPVLRDVLCRR